MGRRNILLIALLVCLPGMLWAQGRPVVKGEACSGDLGGTYPGCTVVGAQTDAIDAAAIQTDAVGADEIATGAVGALEIGTDAVNADEIIADAVGTAELDDNTDAPAANELMRVDSADTGTVEYGPCTMSDTGGISCPAVAAPQQSMEDSTNDDSDADYTVLIVDNASNDTQADIQVEIAGTMETWVHLDGLNNDIELGHASGVGDLSLITDGMNVDESELALLDGLTGNIMTDAAVAAPEQTMEDSTNDDGDADYTVLIVDNASNDTQAEFQVEIAGTMQTWIDLDGLTNTLTLGHATGVESFFLVSDGFNVGENEIARLDGLLGNILTDDPTSTTVATQWIYAQDLSTDGTECAQPARVTINSGPVAWAINCPMGTAETDAFIYGTLQLPGGFDQTQTVVLLLSGYLNADNGAGTWYGNFDYQCVLNGEQIDSTWTQAGAADFVMVDGDSIYDRKPATTAAFTPTGCFGASTMFVRWKGCDTDATPSTNCTSSAGFETDVNILNMRLTYAWELAD